MYVWYALGGATVVRLCACGAVMVEYRRGVAAAVVAAFDLRLVGECRPHVWIVAWAWWAWWVTNVMQLDAIKKDLANRWSINCHAEGLVLGSERSMHLLLHYKMRAEWRWSTFHASRHPVLHDSNPWHTECSKNVRSCTFLICDIPGIALPSIPTKHVHAGYNRSPYR